MSDTLHQAAAAFLEALPLGAFIIGQDTHIAFVNPALEALFGYAPGALGTQSLAVLFPHEYQRFQVAPDSVSPRCYRALRGHHQQGHIVLVDVQMQQQRIGDERLVVGYLTDVTLSARREQEYAHLQQQVYQARNVAESIWSYLVLLNEGEQPLTDPMTLTHLGNLVLPLLDINAPVWVTDTPITAQPAKLPRRTKRHQAESALRQQTALTRLLQDVAVAANQASTIEAALQMAVDLICACIEWPVGHALIRDETVHTQLISTTIWHLDDPERFATFRTITEALHFIKHDSLPGSVLGTGKPFWVADMATNLASKRFQLIQNIGVHAGFAFPVLVGNEVVAVLEFFANERHEPNEPLLDVLANVGTQLGRVVERVWAETALRVSEERYRLIAEHTADLIMLVDQAQHITYASPSFHRVLGYDPDVIMHSSMLELIHREDQFHAQAILDGMRIEGFGNATLRFQTAHGAWRWIDVIGNATTQPNALYIVIVGHDVTHHRQVEEAIRLAEVRYRTLVEQLPGIIYTAELDDYSSTTYVSPQIEQILGFTPEEWLADPLLWIKQLHADDRDQVVTSLQTMQQSQDSIAFEYRSLTRDGRVVWLEDNSTIVHNEAGQALFMQGIVRDVTERKQAEEALQRSELLYRTLARNVPNGAVFLVDRDLRFTIADGQELRTRLYTPTSFEGKTLDEVVPADMLAEYRSYYCAALAGTSIATEAVIRDRYQQEHHYMVYCVPVRNDQGAIYAAMGMFQNITELKRAERELRDERALLTQRIEERTTDLSAANAELARVARLKDEFLANMSHELRTPLNAVLGFAETLREQVYGPLNVKQDRFLQMIEESGRDLLALINDILDLAKIDAGKMDLDIEPTIVEQICHASLRMVQQLASKKQIVLQVLIDSHAELVLADPRRLKQVLVNLLSNAIKFTPIGGASGLEVKIDTSQQVLHFTVWDTGIGIAPNQLAMIFQPFVQLDSQLTRQYEGTGLGLALVYRMIELHGGSVAVTSDVGVGSRFTVTLPWYHEANLDHWQVPARAELASSARPSIQRALIIADSAPDTELLTQYLAEHNIATEVIPLGSAATAYAQRTQPDVILLDLELSGRSGWDVLTQLKANPNTYTIPILVSSVASDQQYGNKLGAAALLVKPFTSATLHAALHQVAQAQVLAAPPQHASLPAVVPLQPPVLATILLAEDNELNITTVADYLTGIGYHVVVARNGEEAVALTREVQPQLILMDVQMPKMDGLEAIRHIRADTQGAMIPIIALTALAMVGDRARCLNAGATAYFSKPVRLKELAIVIASYLRVDSAGSLKHNED